MEQIIIAVFFVAAFAIKELLFPDNTKAVYKQLYALGIQLNAPESALVPIREVDDKKRSNDFNHTMSLWLNGRKLIIQQYKISGEGGSIWHLKVAWRCQNPHKIRLTVTPEWVWTKVKKAVGKKDLEVFNEPFDDLFQVETNNRLFVLSAFSDELCNGLVSNYQKTSMLEAKRDGLYYTERIKIDSPKVRERIFRLIQILRPLADAVENWNPKMIGQESD